MRCGCLKPSDFGLQLLNQLICLADSVLRERLDLGDLGVDHREGLRVQAFQLVEQAHSNLVAAHLLVLLLHSGRLR